MLDRDTDLWRQYCAAENAFIMLRMRLVKEAADLSGLLRDALHRVNDRGNALRLLLNLPVDVSIPHLDRLVFLCSVSHSDIVPSRVLVRRVYAKGYRDQIAQAVDAILTNAGEEEYRRFAELYAQIDDPLLRAHLTRCAQHPDPDIQEISGDFSSD